MDRIMLHIEDAYHDCASVEFQKLPLYQITDNRHRMCIYFIQFVITSNLCHVSQFEIQSQDR